MQLDGRPAVEHLTYCTNVHPGEDLPAVMDALERHVARIKALTAPDRPFGIGLRLSAAAAASLEDEAAMAAMAALLDRHGAYVFTINGFPYGTFHGSPVKAQVYAPDWGDQARLSYTDRLATALARLLPAGVEGSISTVPLGRRGMLKERCERIVSHLLLHVANLVSIHRTSGTKIALALEAEPGCALETTAEVVAFIKDRLLAPAALDVLASAAGLTRPQAETAIRQHIGVCLDVCHAAVEFEDVASSIGACRAAEIAIPKMQLSSALRIPAMDEVTARALRCYDEPTYLHQVVARRDGALYRYPDLGEALDNLPANLGAEWRVHFHVPLFRRELDAFSTTQDVLAEVLALQRANPVAPHLEIETYTWDVLPPTYRAADLNEAIAREYNWVRERLAT